MGFEVNFRADLAGDTGEDRERRGGKAGAFAQSASARAESGVSLAGLQTKAQPARSAAPPCG